MSTLQPSDYVHASLLKVIGLQCQQYEQKDDVSAQIKIGNPLGLEGTDVDTYVLVVGLHTLQGVIRSRVRNTKYVYTTITARCPA